MEGVGNKMRSSGWDGPHSHQTPSSKTSVSLSKGEANNPKSLFNKTINPFWFLIGGASLSLIYPKSRIVFVVKRVATKAGGLMATCICIQVTNTLPELY